MQNKQSITLELGRELNRDIIEDLKLRQEYYPENAFKEFKKEMNKERIKALGMYIIQGGKSED